jgi:hypothetical protein
MNDKLFLWVSLYDLLRCQRNNLLKADYHYVGSITPISRTARWNETDLTRAVLKPHIKHQYIAVRDHHVLSLGKSQGKSDSDGGYTRYVTSVNDKL